MNTYSIQTLTDIFDKVPANKIRECMLELSELLASAAETRDKIKATLDKEGFAYVIGSIISLPSHIEWIDDGNGEISLAASTKDGEQVKLFSTTKIMGATK